MEISVLESEIASVERHISDKQLELQIDNDTATRERERFEYDISAAQHEVHQSEADSANQQSWSNRVDILRSQMERELMKIVNGQKTHQAELDALMQQKQDLERQLAEAREREE